MPLIEHEHVDQELSELCQALMQQALAMAPVHAATRSSIAASGNAPPPAAAQDASQFAPPVALSRPASPPAASATKPGKPGKSTERTRPVPPARPTDPLALARAGASVQVLMQRCALSRAEAELVISVHGGKGRAAA